MHSLFDYAWIGKMLICTMHKNAFQWDAYRPLVNRIPACTVAGGVPAQEGVYLPGGVYLPKGVPAQVLPL